MNLAIKILSRRTSWQNCCSLLICLYITACNNNDHSPLQVNSTKDTARVNLWLQNSTTVHRNDLDSQFYYLSKALERSTALHYVEGEANAKAKLAGYYRAKGEFVEAVSNSLSAINLFDSLHLSQKKINAQLVLSTIYKEMGGDRGTVDYLNKAYSLAEQALQSAEQSKDSSGIINALNNEGIILRDISGITNNPGLMDTAFEKYQRAIDLLQASPDSINILPRVYNNISAIYIERYKNYPRAIEVLQRAIELNRKKNDLASITYSYAYLSNAYLGMGNMAKAKEWALKMLELSREIHRPHRVLNAYEHNMNVNKALHLYDSALYYSELYLKLSDSLTNLSKTQQISEMQTKYETVKKELQITQLNKATELKTKQIIWALVISGLLALLAVVFYSRFRLKKRANDEKVTLLREIHHRVKNNLQIISSLLNIQSAHVQDENVLSSIQEGQNRVQAMSLIHQNLYQSEHLSNVDIENYLRQLVEYLSNMYSKPGTTIDVTVQANNISFDIDTAIPLGLIVNELVSNAYKYAFEKKEKGNIKVEVKAIDKMEYELSVVDDGKGLSKEIDPQKSKSLGLKLVQILTRQLRGKFSAQSLNGTQFLISFKDIRAYNAARV